MTKLLVMLTLVASAIGVWQPTAHAGDKDLISLHYKDADIVPLLMDVGKKAGKSLIIDPQVRGKITVESPEPVTPEEAWSVVCSALALNGLTTVPDGKFLRVLQAQNASRSNLETFYDQVPEGPERFVTVFFHLKHYSAKEMYNSLGPILSSRLGELRTVPDENLLIVSDYVSNIKRIKKIVEQVDDEQKLQAKGPKHQQ